jgi:protein TonB
MLRPRLGKIQGTVVMSATISANGDVEDVTLISGHLLLAPSAMEAVKEWKYKPSLSNGQAVKIKAQVSVTFVLQDH